MCILYKLYEYRLLVKISYCVALFEETALNRWGELLLFQVQPKENGLMPLCATGYIADQICSLCLNTHSGYFPVQERMAASVMHLFMCWSASFNTKIKQKFENKIFPCKRFVNGLLTEQNVKCEQALSSVTETMRADMSGYCYNISE